MPLPDLHNLTPTSRATRRPQPLGRGSVCPSHAAPPDPFNDELPGNLQLLLVHMAGSRPEYPLDHFHLPLDGPPTDPLSGTTTPLQERTSTLGAGLREDRLQGVDVR